MHEIAPRWHSRSVASEREGQYNSRTFPERVPVRAFEYACPQSLAEALAILTRTDGQVRPLVGGTDLIDQMRVGRRRPSLVLDIKGIPEARRLEYDRQGLHIGSAVSCTDIYSYGLAQDLYPAVVQGAALIGGLQIQNRASIGGNVSNAAPSADTVPSLLCYDAIAVMVAPQGQRQLPLEQFFTGPGQTVLQEKEFLLEVLLPPPPAHSKSQYLRFIPREEMDIAVAGVGSLVALDRRSKRCTRARIALAAVAPTPIRAREAEAALEGNVITQELMREAGERAAAAIRPISDVRGSAEYRRELVKVLTRRALQGCLDALDA